MSSEELSVISAQHKTPLTQASADRLARVDAVIFASAWLLLCFIAFLRQPDWNPAHLDLIATAGALLLVAAGAAIVFWRVRTSYATEVASIWRAAGEGLLAAAALASFIVLTDSLTIGYLFGWEAVVGNWRSLSVEFYASTYGEPALITILSGAAIGVVLWLINGFSLKSRHTALRPT